MQIKVSARVLASSAVCRSSRGRVNPPPLCSLDVLSFKPKQRCIVSWPCAAAPLEQGWILPHGSVTVIDLLPGGLHMLAAGPVEVGFFIPCSLQGLDLVFSSWLNPWSVWRPSGMENQGPRARKKGKPNSMKRIELAVILEPKECDWQKLLNHMKR